MYAGLLSMLNYSCMQYHLKTFVFGLLCMPLILISSHLDEAWEKIEHEIGGYSAWALNVNIINGVLLQTKQGLLKVNVINGVTLQSKPCRTSKACSARSHFKPVKVYLFSCVLQVHV